MGEAIGDVLTPALGVALSPFPIVAVILMLFSARARLNGSAFVAGWVAGLIIVVGLVLVFAGSAEVEDTADGPSTAASVIHLVLGIGLILLGLKDWAGRPKGESAPPMPKWMATIDKTTPLVAVGLGALFSGVNPKNLIFNVAAGTAIASAGASAGGGVVAMIVYIVIASVSVSVAGPVIWYLAAPDSAALKLDQVRVWLIHNNAVIMAVMFLLLGAGQIGKGISGFGS